MKKEIILGSGSPRRKQLLGAHYKLRILRPDIDETERKNEPPEKYVRRVSEEKWAALHHGLSSTFILVTADTTVSMNQKIFGKAGSRKQAEKMIRAFSGKQHEVMTAVCVGRAGESRPRQRLVRTRVKFRSLSSAEISHFLDTKDWQGKAGAYAIQGPASAFVDAVYGSLTNVIGLPLRECLEMIEQAAAR